MEAFSTLEQKIETLIRGLHWKDFEFSVELTLVKRVGKG